MKSILLAATAIMTVAFGTAGWAQNRPAQPAPRQPAPAAPAPAPAAAQPPSAPQQDAQNQARVTGWVSRCVANARAAAPECSVEQAMALVATGQNVMSVAVVFAPDTKAARVQLQLPLGSFLPAGVKLRTDTGVGVDLAYQVCDNRGCFTGTPMTPELLNALKSARRLEATVQNMAREQQLLSMPLDGFTAAYERAQ